MRALILLAGAALAVSGCDTDQPAENATNVEGGLAAEKIAANDTTSIDAATGEDSNMAADVNFTAEEADNLSAGANTNADSNRSDDSNAGNAD